MSKSSPKKDSPKEIIRKRREYIRLLLTQKHIHQIYPLLEKYRQSNANLSDPLELLKTLLALSKDLVAIIPKYKTLLESGDLNIVLADLLINDDISKKSLQTINLTGVKLVNLTKPQLMPKGVYLQLLPETSARNIKYFIATNISEIKKSLKDVYEYKKKPEYPKTQPRSEKTFINRLYPWMYAQFEITDLEKVAKELKKLSDAEKHIVFKQKLDSRVRKEKLISIILKHKHKVNMRQGVVRLRISEGEKRMNTKVK